MYIRNYTEVIQKCQYLGILRKLEQPSSVPESSGFTNLCHIQTSDTQGNSPFAHFHISYYFMFYTIRTLVDEEESDYHKDTQVFKSAHSKEIIRTLKFFKIKV